MTRSRILALSSTLAAVIWLTAHTAGCSAGSEAETEPAAIEASPAAQAETTVDLIARGMEVYQAQRCRTCHSIDGDGNRRSPLDGVGGRLSEEDLRTWIVAPQEMQPGVSKRAYDRLPPADLDALVAYMRSLETPEAP